MRKIVLALLVITLGVSLSNLQVFAAEKIGYVNFRKIINEYDKAKEYDKILEKTQNDYEREGQKRIDEIKEMQDKLDLLNEKQKSKRQSEIDEKMKSFRGYERDKIQDLRKEADEKKSEIFKDIEKAVSQYAEREGYTFIFNDMVFAYKLKNYDLTDKIIKIVNKNYKKKK